MIEENLLAKVSLIMIFVAIDCKMIKLYLYDCVYCNQGILMFNLLFYLLIVDTALQSIHCLKGLLMVKTLSTT